ncbi:MAG: thioredoxin-dependent thiol peroxidase [Spirochaetota bacterium]|nr:thioredoxin-dependent thiol peroxidase [Spirochaetota bacterium]
MIEEGKPAPDFSLTASNNETVTLSQFKSKNVILYFYPKDNTPGCTREALSFRDDYKHYTEKNTVILGISKDSIKSHCNFIEKHNLPFLLLTDPDAKVCELYDVIKEKVNFGKRYLGIERSTFIIDPDGKIKKIFRKVKVDSHSKQILEFL